ncbi:MAG: SDR family NAD(P)-dependent oxidoreductase [Clostridiaceae bacterium]|nr:SDR family NAD(P)-dependent oxidoreductase [Clostridiaceae bacterium]
MGKTVVITGATSGIGLATTIMLAQKGAFVIGAGRDKAKCQKAEETILENSPGAQVTFCIADLSCLSRVKVLALNINRIVNEKGCKGIDVLINNAATVSSWYTTTPEGFETQFAVNHLAPFLLTHELLPLLKKTPEARIIMVSSGSHFRTRFNWDDIMLRKRYNCLLAYKQTKLANVMFSIELNRRLGEDSTVRAFSVDPGLVNTEIGMKGTSGLVKWFWKKRSSHGITPREAASGIVYLASEPSVMREKAVYWKNCKSCNPSRYSQKGEALLKLWEISEKMCGISSEKYKLPPVV